MGREILPASFSARTSAVQVAHHLGTKYREGFIKNRYIGRTFIMPGQAERAQSVRRKLNAIDLEFDSSFDESLDFVDTIVALDDPPGSVGVAYSIHIVTRFYIEVSASRRPSEAVATAMARVRAPCRARFPNAKGNGGAIWPWRNNTG